MTVALGEQSAWLKPREECNNRIRRVFEIIQELLETFQFWSERRILPGSQVRGPKVIPIDVAGSNKDAVDIDFGRQSRCEVRARHDAYERFTRASARHEIEQGEPVFNEGDPKQRNTGIKTMRDSVAREHILDHLAIRFDVADHHGNFVWTLPPV